MGQNMSRIIPKKQQKNVDRETDGGYSISMNGEPLQVAGSGQSGRPSVPTDEKAGRHVSLSTLEIKSLARFYRPGRRSPRTVIVWLLEAEIERRERKGQ